MRSIINIIVGAEVYLKLKTFIMRLWFISLIIVIFWRLSRASEYFFLRQEIIVDWSLKAIRKNLEFSLSSNKAYDNDTQEFCIIRLLLLTCTNHYRGPWHRLLVNQLPVMRGIILLSTVKCQISCAFIYQRINFCEYP